MSFASTDSRGSVHRAATSLRQSVASAVSVVEEAIEVGTIGGTVLNTTCNVIGAGVLFLPLAAFNAGLGWAIILVIGVAFLGSFSAYILFVGCDRTGTYFLNEILAVSIVGRPKRRNGDHDLEHDEQCEPLTPKQVPVDAKTPLIITQPQEAGAVCRHQSVQLASDRADETDDEDAHLDDDEKKKNFMRMVISMMVDFIVFVNNYCMLAIYTRVIIDSMPPVIRDFLHAPEDTIWVKELTWLIIAAVIFFGLTSVRNFAELKWSSILGIGTIMWAALAILIEYGRHGYQGGDDHREIKVFNAGPSFAGAMATLSVAYGYHFNAPSFYHELHDRTPKRMMKTVAISFPIIAVTYICVAIFGYLSFGQHVNDEAAGGNIVNNYGTDVAVINSVRLGLFAHFACVYPVMAVCVRHSFHRFVLTFTGRRKEAIHPDMPARVPRVFIVAEAFILVSTSALFAYKFKNVGVIVGYVGAFCGATMMLTIPGIIGLCIWAEMPDEKDLTDEHQRLVIKRRLADPPPLYSRRRLMRGLSLFLIVFGLAVTFAALESSG